MDWGNLPREIIIIILQMDYSRKCRARRKLLTSHLNLKYILTNRREIRLVVPTCPRTELCQTILPFPRCPINHCRCGNKRRSEGEWKWRPVEKWGSNYIRHPRYWDNEKEDWEWTKNSIGGFKPKKYGIRKLWIDMC